MIELAQWLAFVAVALTAWPAYQGQARYAADEIIRLAVWVAVIAATVTLLWLDIMADLLIISYFANNPSPSGDLI